MKKVLTVVALALILGAVYYMYVYTHKKTTLRPFTSIQDAITHSLSVSCNFSTPQGKHVLTYIKNGEIRTDVTGKTSQETESVIIKDQKMYYWNTTMGTMIKEPVHNFSQVTAKGTTQSDTVKSPVDSLEQYKKYCKITSLSDNLFVLPSTIKFVDESQQVFPTGASSYR